MDNYFSNQNCCNACPPSNEITMGVILEIDRQNRSFTTISNGNPLSIIQFNAADNALIFDRFGRPIGFNQLTAGMRVWVRHSASMTFSIPPQATAYEIRVR